MGGTRPSGAKRSVTLATAVHHRLMPTPNAADGAGGPGHQGRDGGLNLRTSVTLLPTPVVNDMGEGKTVERWDEWTTDLKGRHGNGNGHGASLAIEAQRLLPTPVTDPNSHNGHARDLGSEARLMPTPWASDGEKGGPNQRGSSGDLMLPAAVQPGRWGAYAAAVARWESVTGRTAPSATEPGTKGQPRLSAAFVEWLMGLEPGRVTDVPGVGRNAQLKALGNGVVPQQAALAVGAILTEIPASVLDRLRTSAPVDPKENLVDTQRERMLEVLLQHLPVSNESYWMCRGCIWHAPLVDVNDDTAPADHQVEQLALAGLAY